MTLLELVARLAGHRVLVAGDVCLDEYLAGTPERLSREAPVPVLEFSAGWTIPGAAANPALNIVALGSQATMVSLVGEDESATALLDAFARRGVATDGIVRDPGFRTGRKTRILAQASSRQPQQVARLDRTPPPPGPDQAAALGRHLARLAPQHGAILLSDYRQGVISPPLVQATREAARQYGLLATVDSQGDLLRFEGFTLVKANREEAEATIGAPLQDDAAIEHHGRALRARLGAGSIVITRGADGLSLIGPDAVHHLPATNRTEVFDVTGAGDTVIAVMTLALLGGASSRDAARLANAAAGLVIRRIGNATPSPQELRDAVRGLD